MMAGPKETDENELVDPETGEVTPLEDDEPLPDTHMRSFSVFLRQLEDAELDLTEELHLLLLKLRRHAQNNTTAKGKLTLELFLMVDARDQVETRYAIKIKEPPKPTAKSVHWIDPKGALTIEDPRQQKLNLKAVPKSKQKTAPAAGDKKPRSV